MIYIGADPGKSGGIAALGPDGMRVWKMPETEADIYQLFRELHRPCITRGPPRIYAFIEHVSSRPRPGKPCPVCKRRPTEGTKSAFTFGQNYGGLRMALTASGIPWEPVPPSSWLREMKLTKKPGESETQWKNRHKGMAQRLWPGVTVTHFVADAMLLAEVCRRSRQEGVRV